MNSHITEEAFDQSILDSTFMVPWKIDHGSKEFSFIGSQIVELLGWPFSTWKTVEDWIEKVHPHDQKNVRQYYFGTHKVGSNFDLSYRAKNQNGQYIWLRDKINVIKENESIAIVGYKFDISHIKKAEELSSQTSKILEMIARGKSTTKIYDAIALLYEGKHPGLRCSMLELADGKLLHGGAPSLPKEYCEAVHGLKNGPDVGSCGTSTYTGKRCVVENIETDKKWAEIKHVALPHGMRSCWSEPIISSKGVVLGAFGMYYNYPSLPSDEESDDLIAAARLAGIVMERDHDQKLIRQLAYTDELTGLSSRAHFYMFMEDLFSLSRKHSRKFYLMYVDLDNFKWINDSFGHDVGDQVLKEVAHRLKESSQNIDFISRLSGDEFCIIVEDVSDILDASNLAQSCLDAISKPLELVGREFLPKCSIGISLYPEDGETLSLILKSADTALYSAKANGKNSYAFYNSELTQKAEHCFKVQQYLREAINKQQLSLVYQPQVSTESGKVIGIEALSRWYHPELGHVSPVEFIDVAERIGMIKPLTEWVLSTACLQAVAWAKGSHSQMRIAINISPSHFLDNDFTQLIKTIIEETGINPNNLELEVTEGVTQSELKNLSVFKELKALGVLLAIDDFGTGYSSFASLKYLNVDSIKIDKYFIDDLIENSDSRCLVSSMIDIGHNFKQTIVAEGVENIEQFDALRMLGCEVVQGYLFSKPLPASEIPQVLDKVLN